VSDLAGDESVDEATETWVVAPNGCERVPEVGPFCKGCVGCILTVAFGSAGAALFGGSLGKVMRAVSFFGEAGLATTPLGAAGAAGFKGTVGLPVNGGGFGGGTALLSGLVTGPPGTGGGGITPLAGAPPGGKLILEVSFFGTELSGWLWLPGTLIRTVSRFTAGWSPFGGRVIRMVSFFVESSSCGTFEEGFSSAI
jgi:hypothetical protein